MSTQTENVNVRMVNQNWWITTLMIKEHKYCPPLTKAIKCDVLIVGGGFSGVSAAVEFLRKGAQRGTSRKTSSAAALRAAAPAFSRPNRWPAERQSAVERPSRRDLLSAAQPPSLVEIERQQRRRDPDGQRLRFSRAYLAIHMGPVTRRTHGQWRRPRHGV